MCGRVAAVFNDNGAGVRGDMKAVVRAILTTPKRAEIPDRPALRIAARACVDGDRPGAWLVRHYRWQSLGRCRRQSWPAAVLAPTVFNYFSPDTTIPGTRHLAPEFGIHTTEYRRRAREPCLHARLQRVAADTTMANGVGTRLNTQQFESLADNPGAAVDDGRDALLGGRCLTGRAMQS